MTSINMYEGKLLTQGGRFCIVVFRFNSFIVEQAIERVGTKAGNKEAEAAMSAIVVMVSLFSSFETR